MGWLSALLVSLGFLISASEWIEIPQFSDQRKVYRTPTLHKLVLRQEIIDLRNISQFSKNRRTTFSNNQSLFMDNIKHYTTEGIISSTVIENNEDTVIDSDENIASVSPEEESVTRFKQSLIIDNSNEDISAMVDPMKTKIIATATDSLNKTQYFNKRDNDNEFLNYLPIDLFKRVHKTLKSQSSTLKGKIKFLKAFEYTLLNEIESRLSKALRPSRMPREASDHYDFYYHNDKIGFPSLEGTLMAISFLTFAVYLIRLVMMLFRNAGSIGITPIIIGRKKRSFDDMNEETTRILSYLDSTLPSHY